MTGSDSYYLQVSASVVECQSTLVIYPRSTSWSTSWSILFLKCDQHLIDILIDTQSTVSRSTVSWPCRRTHMHRLKISWLWSDCWQWHQLIVDLVSNKVSMECQSSIDRGSIKGIHRHLSADVFNIHDLKSEHICSCIRERLCGMSLKSSWSLICCTVLYFWFFWLFQILTEEITPTLTKLKEVRTIIEVF